MRQFDTGKETGGLQRIVLLACAAVAMLGIVFTLGFFIGRASAGTQVTVYLQNPEGVYVPAQTVEPFSEVPEVRLMPSDEDDETPVTAPTTAQTTEPSLSVITSTTIIPKRTEAPAVTTTGRPEEPAGTTAASSTASQTAVSQAPAETTTAVTSTTEPPQTTTAEAPKTTAAATTLGVININTATQAQLETLPGIGPVKAAAIIAYRQEHGAFASVDDLIKVSGIGKKTLSDLRPYATVG